MTHIVLTDSATRARASPCVLALELSREEVILDYREFLKPLLPPPLPPLPPTSPGQAAPVYPIIIAVVGTVLLLLLLLLCVLQRRFLRQRKFLRTSVLPDATGEAARPYRVGHQDTVSDFAAAPGEADPSMPAAKEPNPEEEAEQARKRQEREAELNAMAKRMQQKKAEAARAAREREAELLAAATPQKAASPYDMDAIVARLQAKKATSPQKAWMEDPFDPDTIKTRTQTTKLGAAAQRVMLSESAARTPKTETSGLRYLPAGSPERGSRPRLEASSPNSSPPRPAALVFE